MSSEYEAGRELDALIAEKVMGWQRCHAELRGGSGFPPGISFSIHNVATIPAFSTDWGAAGQVIDYLCAARAAHWTLTIVPGRTMASVSIWQDGICMAGAPAPTVPLAICRAALAALEVNHGE